MLRAETLTRLWLNSMLFPLTTSYRRNVSLGQKEDRLLLTGFHTVRDVHCNNCDTILGWRYVRHSWHDAFNVLR